jgi:hypothetical protein
MITVIVLLVFTLLCVVFGIWGLYLLSSKCKDNSLFLCFRMLLVAGAVMFTLMTSYVMCNVKCYDMDENVSLFIPICMLVLSGIVFGCGGKIHSSISTDCVENADSLDTYKTWLLYGLILPFIAPCIYSLYRIGEYIKEVGKKKEHSEALIQARSHEKSKQKSQKDKQKEIENKRKLHAQLEKARAEEAKLAKLQEESESAEEAIEISKKQFEEEKKAREDKKKEKEFLKQIKEEEKGNMDDEVASYSHVSEKVTKAKQALQEKQKNALKVAIKSLENKIKKATDEKKILELNSQLDKEIEKLDRLENPIPHLEYSSDSEEEERRRGFNPFQSSWPRR